MYSFKILSAAQKEMVDIASYIRGDLGNPAAADKLALEIVRKAQKIADFPYSYQVISSLRLPTEHEYRRALVRRYLIVYYIDEKNKVVNIAHVVYAGRNLEKLLK